ncbi:MAG TPA: hypothetical protein VM261_29310 [Kofleriaceae bacterium]|nr:hypothetical protein [Kofleriaceae bacterium]
MRILRLVLVFGVFGFGSGSGFGFGCGGGSRPAPVVTPSDDAVAEPASGALCKPPAAGRSARSALVLPASAPSHDLKLDVDRPGGVEPADWKGKLTVDGVVTAAMWPMNAPLEYRLADGRYLLNDYYNANLLSIWDPRTKTLTELARGVLMPVPGHGALIYTSADDTGAVGILSDVDPDAPRLRELYRFERMKGQTDVVGAVDGMPALLVRPPVSATSFRAEAPAPVTILCLSGAGVSASFDAVVPEGFHPVSLDPVDGHRLLLLGTVDHERERLEMTNRGAFGYEPFDAEVAVLDLATGAHRSLGRTQGGWTQTTAVPHPVLDVAWDDGTHDRSPTYTVLPDAAITLVDPATERLVSGVR